MKKPAIRILFPVLFLLATELRAQEEFIDPPSREITTVPFTQLAGGVVILHAKLGSFPDTLNFILDTGSSGISLDSTLVDYLGLVPELSDRTIRGVAGIKQVSFIYNQSLQMPGIKIDSLDFHINDYGILAAVYGIPIDGIIGYSVIKRYIIKLDYDTQQLTFCTPGTIRYPRGGYMLKPVINLLAAQTLQVKDARTIQTKFLYDMGAGLCMLFSRDFVNDSLFLNRKAKSFIKEGEGLGGKLDMELRVIKEVRVGPYRFRKVPSFVFEDKHNVTNYPFMGGLIGNDILRRFNVIINYQAGDIYLTPNTHFRDQFDYAYSGLEFYLVNGQILVGDVAENSPAEKAGVKEGDVILAVNKDFSQNLNAYKIALQAANEWIRLILRRDDKIIEIGFKVRSIL